MIISFAVQKILNVIQSQQSILGITSWAQSYLAESPGCAYVLKHLLLMALELQILNYLKTTVLLPLLIASYIWNVLDVLGVSQIHPISPHCLEAEVSKLLTMVSRAWPRLDIPSPLIQHVLTKKNETPLPQQT